jgi:predicted small integral membrane protein
MRWPRGPRADAPVGTGRAGAGAARHRTRLWWGWALAPIAFAGCVAVICAVAAHHDCMEPGPPVSRPEPGTPRAGYCGTVDDRAVRAVIVFAGVAVVALAAVALRRRPLWAVIVTALVVLTLMANAIVASSLTFAYTI